MHLTHQSSAITFGMIVNHRQSVLPIRGSRQLTDTLTTGRCYKLVGEFAFLSLVALFKLALDQNIRLMTLTGLLKEGLALGLLRAIYAAVNCRV
ncbi:MAG: hypothetical protein B6D75_11210 [gamma proteobacterium symbiont of Stewartia floridana]|nr:MAG: hypothetical protein B6D75_11210 [gamma proteobacterium symbiont of Stewartia floridana]RLW66838.1 MAG: hypothetical protein B6D73_01385 [gamma proteobacterium symbiont of Stewartia floridana]